MLDLARDHGHGRRSRHPAGAGPLPLAGEGERLDDASDRGRRRPSHRRRTARSPSSRRRGSARSHADLSYRIVGAPLLLAGPDSPMGGDLQSVNLASPGTRIGGGTDEIQLNVLGERALGLPVRAGRFEGRSLPRPQGRHPAVAVRTRRRLQAACARFIRS